MVERLEHLARQHGLKFSQGPSGTDVHLASDMFSLQVVLESHGGVKDVRVTHNSEVVVRALWLLLHIILFMCIVTLKVLQ